MEARAPRDGIAGRHQRYARSRVAFDVNVGPSHGRSVGADRLGGEGRAGGRSEVERAGRNRFADGNGGDGLRAIKAQAAGGRTRLLIA